MKAALLLFSFVLIIFNDLYSQWIRTAGPEVANEKFISINEKDVLILGTARGVYRSIDYGVTWQLSEATDKLDFMVTSVAINSWGKVYVSADSLYRTSDDCNTWDKYYYAATKMFRTKKDNIIIRSNRILLPPGDTVRTINIQFEPYGYHENSGGEIFAFNNDNLHISKDGGLTWSQIKTTLPDKNLSMVINSKGNIYLGTDTKGIYYSNDTGRTWKESGLTNIHISAMAVYHDTLIAATNQGVFRSCDNAVTWSSTPELDQNIDKFVVGSNGYIYGITSNWSKGILRTTDLGYTWERQGFRTGLRNSYCMSLLLNREDELFAFSNCNTLFLSKNHGMEWTMAQNDYYCQYHYLFETAAGTLLCNNRYLGKIIRSTDKGKSWAEVRSDNLVANFIQLPNNNIMTIEGATFLKSTDDGATWIGTNMNFSNCNELLIKDNIIYAICNYTTSIGYLCYKSTDNGNTWKNIGHWTNSGYDFGTIMNNTGKFICNDGNNMIRTSIDTGKTWTDAVIGLPNNRVIKQIKLDASDYVYCVTDKGLYKANSKDATLFWQPVNSEGLTNTDMLCMAIDSEGSIFVSTNGSGVFKLPTGPIAIEPPKKIAPMNGSINHKLNLQLSWQNSNNTIFYRLQFSKNYNFYGNNVMVDDSSLTGTTYNLSGLEENTTYYWRLLVKTNMGYSQWSDIWAFKTYDPADVSDEYNNEPYSWSVQIFNILGQEIIEKQYFCESSELQYYIESENLPSGIYLYRAVSGGYIKANKIIR